MQKLFIVEDEEKIRQELADLLTKNGYSCILTKDFENVVEQIMEAGPDLVLLDLNLPFYDGMYLCRKLREKSDVPIIVVTSSNSDMDELMSMNSGADDFITKPYNVHILLAHISAVLSRVYGKTTSCIFAHKGLSLDVMKSKASYQGKEIDLTKNEMGILRVLMEQAGNIVPRNELIRYLWEMEEFVEDSTLTVNINRLRKKLEQLGLKDYLITRRGQGYMI
ncbi:MAG: response regulator transcription factor [Lachnospiraceae bacterium]|nr:response regulator transcription factor [Lachnospiraceae bacterium]